MLRASVWKEYVGWDAGKSSWKMGAGNPVLRVGLRMTAIRLPVVK